MTQLFARLKDIITHQDAFLLLWPVVRSLSHPDHTRPRGQFNITQHSLNHCHSSVGPDLAKTLARWQIPGNFYLGSTKGPRNVEGHDESLILQTASEGINLIASVESRVLTAPQGGVGMPQGDA